MSEKLECPFCGGTASIAYHRAGDNLLYCQDCKKAFSERYAKIIKLNARIAELEVEKAKLTRKCVIFQTLMENIMGTAIIETEEHGDQTAGAALAAIRGGIYDTYHELQEVDR